MIAPNSHCVYYAQGHYWTTIWIAIKNSVVLDTIVRLSKNKNLITYNCLYL